MQQGGEGEGNVAGNAKQAVGGSEEEEEEGGGGDDDDVGLEAFAHARGRTADSYRRTMGPFFRRAAERALASPDGPGLGLGFIWRKLRELTGGDGATPPPPPPPPPPAWDLMFCACGPLEGDGGGGDGGNAWADSGEADSDQWLVVGLQGRVSVSPAEPPPGEVGESAENSEMK